MLQIYKASAGSGKTYKLAYEYIRSLLGVKGEDGSYRLCLPKYVGTGAEANNRHRYILAITFTNKATEEMKIRIIDELDALSTYATHPEKKANYAKDLCKEYGCTADEMSAVAKHALEQLLHDYGEFNVMTIDAFFQRVLRTFARELDRQGDFNVEMNTFSAVQAAVNAMIDDFNADPKGHPLIEDWIYQYMREQLENGERSNFFNRTSQLHTNLVKLVANICEEQFKPYSEAMRLCLSAPDRMPKLKAEIRKAYTSILTEVKDTSCRVWAELDARGATFGKINGKMTSIEPSFRQYYMTGKPLPKATETVFSTTYDNIISGSSKIFPAKAGVSDECNSIAADLFAYIRQKYARYQELRDMYGSINQLMLLGYAWDYLTDFISQNNLVLISDTNHLLSRIIGKDPTPFIYERMGVQFRNFLIDEFQDTSKMQWANLKPLVANGLDNLHDSLIIGDEKQSIYRFRNSDSSLLHHQVAYVDFPVPHYDTHIAGGGEGENTNYRSAVDVVRFNNTIFAHLAHDLEIDDYDNVEQRIKHTNLPGYVRFTSVDSKTRIPKGSPKGKKAETIADPVNPLEAMAQNMLRQHNEGNYPWSEIAVLVATNLEAARTIEFLLSHYPDIPVVSDEALFLRKSPAVKLIISVLEIIANKVTKRASSTPSRYPTRAEVAMTMSQFGYLYGQGQDAPTAIDKALRMARGEAVSEGEPLVNAIDAILASKPATLTALVETIISELVPENERRTQISYLTAFQDYVTDYCQHHTPSVRGLLTHWEHKKEKLSVAGATDLDAVRVMTIHKSKGLEFGCVHIPFGSWSEGGKTGGHWLPFPDSKLTGFDAELCPPALYVNFSKNTKCYSYEGSLFYSHFKKDEKERYVDTLNMTYVAYTRAERELMVYYAPSSGIGTHIAEIFDRLFLGSGTDILPLRPTDRYDASMGNLEYGQPTTYKPKDNSDDDEPEPMKVDSYGVYIHQSAKVLTTVEDVTDNKEVDQQPAVDPYEENDHEARERGIILHEILSKIETLADVDMALAQVRRSQGLDQKKVEEARMYLSTMLNSEDTRIRRWFVDNDMAYTEQTIYLPVGSKHRKPDEDNKRPDRIVLNTDGSVDVVDYKFTTQTRRKYTEQIKTYVEILHDMGYERVRGYLWYPFIPKIEEVTTY